MIVAQQALQSVPVVGTLSFTSGQKLALTSATWVGTASSSTPPSATRFVIRLVSGAVDIGPEDIDMGGFSLSTSKDLDLPNLASLDGWFAIETASSTAELAILALVGGPA